MLNYENEGVPIIYLDESGFSHSMPRTHGYSLKGERAYGKHDWNSRGRTNAIGAITADFNFIALSLIPVNINSDIFYLWLSQDLLPQITKRSVIVMDNASFHKRSDMIQAIYDANCILEFLPPYSPDLNPIEHKWAQAKAFRRRYRCDAYTLFSRNYSAPKSEVC